MNKKVEGKKTIKNLSGLMICYERSVYLNTK